MGERVQSTQVTQVKTGSLPSHLPMAQHTCPDGPHPSLPSLLPFTVDRTCLLWATLCPIQCYLEGCPKDLSWALCVVPSRSQPSKNRPCSFSVFVIFPPSVLSRSQWWHMSWTSPPPRTAPNKGGSLEGRRELKNPKSCFFRLRETLPGANTYICRAESSCYIDFVLSNDPVKLIGWAETPKV